MNKDTFLIDESLLKKAQKLCAEITDRKASNRAIANIFASELAYNYFVDIEADTKTGIHNIPTVLNDIDISDIYVQSTYIDVRLYFDENDLCVPVSHFKRNVLPVAYMFIRIDKELVNATVTGFITPGNINTANSVNDYYPVNEEDLQSLYDIEQLLNVSYTDEVTDDIKEQIYSYLDGTCKDVDNLYRELINSKESRIMFAKAYATQKFSKELAKDSEFISSIQTDLTNNSDEDTSSELLNGIDDDFELEPAGSDYGDSELTLYSNEISELDNNLDNDELIDSSDESEDILPLISDTDVDLVGEPADDMDFQDLSDSDFETVDNELPDFSEAEDNLTVNSKPNDNTYALEELSDNALLSDYNQDDNDLLENIPDSNELTDIEDITPMENDSVGEIPYSEPAEQNELDNIYSTETTPSLDAIETNNNSSDNNEEPTDNIEQIDDLYPQEEITNYDVPDETKINQSIKVKKKSNFGIVGILGLAIVIGAGAYFGYNKFNENLSSPPPIADEDTNKEVQVPADNNDEAAMPDESLENTIADKSKDEGNSIAIPSIENHLDTTVLVSNLSVTWEVPSGYVSNNSAKRYFTTIGKIVQLKLKTELLLINRPPINNKIVLELKFNPDKQYFEIKDITTSSGEKVIDDAVKSAVRSVLENSVNSNISSFGNIQGNPILVISL